MKDYSIPISRDKVTYAFFIISLILTFLINILLSHLLGKRFFALLDNNGIALAVASLGLSVPTTLSIGSIYWVINKLYTKVLWKCKILDFIRLSSVPDINGEWKGELTSEYKDNNGQCIKRSVIMTIKQDYRRMSVKCSFFDDMDNMTSASSNDLIGLDFDEASTILKFSYSNNSLEIETKGRLYYGYNEFRFSADFNTVSGTYFSGRDTGQSTGIMNLTRCKN